jgi:hypothetical protein
MDAYIKVNNKGSDGGHWTIIILLALLIITGWFAERYYSKAKKQKAISTALSKSLNTLQDSATLYKIRWANGITTQMAVTQPLQIKKDNAKKLFPTDIRIAKKMGAKNEDFNFFSSARTITKDSIRNVPVYVDSLKSLYSTFDDGWTQVKVTIFRDHKADWVVQNKDTIYLTDYYKQHHIWFIRWRTRMDKTAITTCNPHTRISSFKVIKIIH